MSNPVVTHDGGLELAGAPEGFDALITGDLLRARGGVALFVARDLPRANAFIDSLAFFAPEVEVLRLPAWDCLPYDRVSPSPAISAERMSTLTRLANGGAGERPLLVVTTANAAVQRVPARATMRGAAFATHVGRVVNIADLERYFAVNGFQRASTVSERGEFAVRGGVIDVFPPGAEEPVRLDLFGDTLESIRSFDVETQRTSAQLIVADTGAQVQRPGRFVAPLRPGCRIGEVSPRGYLVQPHPADTDLLG